MELGRVQKIMGGGACLFYEIKKKILVKFLFKTIIVISIKFDSYFF